MDYPVALFEYVRDGARDVLCFDPAIRPRILAGRSRSCTFVLPFAELAPEHMAIAYDEGSFWLEALVAGGLVELNDEPVPRGGRRPLTDGDRIGVPTSRGYWLVLVVTIEPAPRPTP